MYNPACYSRQRWTYPKDDDKNMVAALLHLLSVLLICISVEELNWFKVWGGQCTPHLSIRQFIGFGEFYATTHNQYHLRSGGIMSAPNGYIIHYNTSSESLACITPDVANLMHILFSLAILAMCTSCVGFFLDFLGTTQSFLKIIRRNGLPGIITVFIVITIIGTSYLVTRSLEDSLLQMNLDSNVQITYDYGCYLVTAAGSVSILATACNLLQTQSGEESQRHSRLVEDWDGLETFSVGMNSLPHPLPGPQPPPPYTP